MKILHLILCKKWFDEIKSGIKKEEYREIKPFWEKRLNKDYTHILFQLGYSKNAPRMIVEYLGKYEKEIIHEHYNFEKKKVYALKIGRILN